MNGGAGLPEGTPIICRNCGGGMTLQPDASVVCQYCGKHDTLPADQLGRVLEIKNRLALAEQRAAQVKGFDASFAHMFESKGAFLRVGGMYLGMAGFTLFMSAGSLMPMLEMSDKLDGKQLVQSILGSLMAPMLMVGIGLSFGIALLSGRSHYRKHVRPLLMARRPAHPNAPFACRACGGALPPTRSAELPCPYCRVLNLVPQELHGAQANALFNEAEAAQRQLMQAHGAMMSISGKMRFVLIVCCVLTGVVAYGLPMVAMAVLGQM